MAGGIAFRADGVPLPLEDPRVDGLIAAAASSTSPLPVAARVVAAARLPAGALPPAAPTPDDPDPEPTWTDAEIASAVTAWAVRLAPDEDLAKAIADARARLAELRRPDAALTLATAHGTKGLEWDHVAVLGMTEGRFPSARSLADAADPARAMEEERRLAYVAWTRARRSLTLVFDPAAPSPFLLEAFDGVELDLDARETRPR
jgi:DNA helicase-2/ATP-dependent DNA helicase PcrA